MSLMRKMMFTVYRSEMGFEETVAALTRSAEAQGWKIPMTHDLQENYQQAGHPDMTKVKVIYFCNPDGGYQILQDDRNKPLSVMMPMGVSVYETRDGQVHIAGVNLERMGMMFGGTAKKVMQEGAARYTNTLTPIASPVSPPGVNRGRVVLGCLGCLGLVSLIGVVGAVLVAFAMKMMPTMMARMMTTMMPKMMATMEEAGVQPPCAQIILEHLERKG